MGAAAIGGYSVRRFTDDGSKPMTELSTETATQPRAYGTGDASYQAAGGYDGLKQLVDDFYYFMETLPEARHVWMMHNHEDMATIHDKLTRFLCGWLGGPRLFSEKYGPIIIPSFHRQFPIGASERDAWLLCMRKAAERQPWDQAFKDYLLQQLYRPAELSRTQD